MRLTNDDDVVTFFVHSVILCIILIVILRSHLYFYYVRFCKQFHHIIALKMSGMFMDFCKALP